MTIFFCKGLTRNPDIRNTPSGFCPISGDWDKLGIINLIRTSLTKFYSMLQNTRVMAFTVSELLRENQQGGKMITPPPRLGSIEKIERIV